MRLKTSVTFSNAEIKLWIAQMMNFKFERIGRIHNIIPLSFSGDDYQMEIVFEENETPTDK